MRNQEIASVFRGIADQLELDGTNPFRIRAYRRAATSLEKLTIEASHLSGQNRLREIPGIGNELAQKIRDLVNYGEIQKTVFHEEATVKTIAAPFELPGLDPKIARTLHQRFLIETLEDLERLARSHLLRTVPSLGTRLERTIMKGLDSLREKGRGSS